MKMQFSCSLVALIFVVQTVPAQETCDYGPSYEATAWGCVAGSNPGAPCSFFGDPVCTGGSCEISSGGGEATYYNYTGYGACGFGMPDPGTYIVAIGTPDWGDSAMCGRCVQVTGPLGTIVAKVFDQCAECLAGDIDLDADAFAAITNPEDGRVTVHWQTIACDEPGNVQLVNKDGINAWWYAVFVMDHRHGISSLEIHDTDSTVWVAGTRQAYNAWVVEDAGGFDLPLSVRLTDVLGNIIESSDVVSNFDGASEFDFGSQFPICQEGIFADDFESGNTDAWSTVSP